MKKLLYTLSLVAFSATASAQSVNLLSPAGSMAFGETVTVLANGNYVVTDPSWGTGGLTNAGAVYLYNGQTNALISTLTGSQANDYVGNYGVTALSNGNYVVSSSSWNNGTTATYAGAVTWGNGITGVSGVVSTSNSLVGSSADDYVGNYGVTALSNGNYVVRSPSWSNGTTATYAGAVTWGNGTTGVSGAVSASNSLVGSATNDEVGNNGVKALSNGNYVVQSSSWNNGSVINVGAVTWGSGTAGVSGAVSTSNSLVGSAANDEVGNNGVTALSNGNYVVTSFSWGNGSVTKVGAVTWGSGTNGVSGAVSTSNSLVGSAANDEVGSYGVTALSNGNYVVQSSSWDNGSIANVGAVTWSNGTTGITGAVSTSNSLVGSAANDEVGYGVTALSNGNYVVQSSSWDNGSIANVGAVTWGNGTTGIIGAVSTSNSLVGSSTDDYVGNYGVTALSNGNYVVRSSSWNNGTTATYAGAATWGNGTTGVSGAVSSANSLVGSTANDYIGYNSITALNNGNYVVSSPYWNNGSITDAGAATWGNGTTGVTGALSSTNSLVGSTASDKISFNGVTALPNGNYVVGSAGWDNGLITDAGAVTWGSGTTGITGAVSSTNSLIGSNFYDRVGSFGITVLSNGNYVLSSAAWDNGTVTDVGAVTWVNGTTATSGVISSANSLMGNAAGDQIGDGSVTALSNGNYIVQNYAWHNGSTNYAGSVTLSNGADGNTTGPVTTCNSVVGNTEFSSFSFNFHYNDTYENLIVGNYQENKVTVFNPIQTVLASASSIATNSAGGTATVAFVDNTCALIASLKPSGTAPVSGSIDAKVYVQTTTPTTAGGTAYVRRHYDILPATGANTATAKVILYFTQADFDNYNSNNGTAADLPANPTDAAGKAALRVTQQHGTSTTGMPGSYTGGGLTPANVLITPGANNVVWNAALSRWEVSFDVIGFSGFFVSGGNITPVPVKLLGFTAKAESNRNRLDWNTATETEGVTFEITRSADGSRFEKIGTLAGKSRSAVYTFYDEQPLEGSNYYRLNIVDPSGEQVFSNVVLVKRNALSGGITVSPIPAGNTLTITNSNSARAGSTVTALNLQGQVMATATLETSTPLNVQGWPAGIYLLKFADGSVVKVVKQ